MLFGRAVSSNPNKQHKKTYKANLIKIALLQKIVRTRTLAEVYVLVDDET